MIPCALLFVAASSASFGAQEGGTTDAASRSAVHVPKLWDEAELATWATPLAGLGLPPSFTSEAEYYAAPIDNLRTYPMYHPRSEPPGYREWLAAQGPQRLIEPEKLVTKEDWIAAGKRVFDELDSAAARSADPEVLAYFSSAAAIDAHDETITPDGVILDFRWVVDLDGTLKVSLSSCQGCHSHLMPDGSLLAGAPCNFDFATTRAGKILLETFRRSPKLSQGKQLYSDFGVPWAKDDPHAPFAKMSDEEAERFLSQDSGAPIGTIFARFNGSPLYVTRMADLIGIADRRYLDATGTHKNRGPEDVARYGILVEFADQGEFGPHQMLPPEHRSIRFRPPDEAMYAMALYLYSIQPPRSPHPVGDEARRGKEVFELESCGDCHPPPAYTNNELVRVPGFDGPAPEGLAVSKRRVGTDPGLAMRTRKGTGYYKVPSLRGLWYRGLFEHSGSVLTLEDWFDPARLRDDYAPTGWRGPGVEKRAVPGHEFGLDLDAEDKRDLIAFLLTL
jgi:hypothetical protein